jgi:hypothetical protein
MKMEELAKAKIVWQRLIDTKWEPIKHDDVYVVTCNDIGHRIRAVSVRGIESAPTNIIEGRPTTSSYARAQIKTKTLSFLGMIKLSGMIWNITVSGIGISMLNRNGTNKTGKWKYIQCCAIDATVNEMELCLDPATKFLLMPTLADERLENLIGKQQIRDFVVLVINGLKNC